jgi:hypothetical protein
MEDTIQLNIYKKMTPNQRLETATNLFDFTFEHLQAYFKKTHPTHTEDKILELVRQRISYGREKNIS